jgi:Tol biopolymer transport system component
MERKRINAVLTVAALALTLLIPTALPLAGTAAPRLEPQPSESLIGLNSTEATESGAPSVASVVQSPGTTTCVSVASNGAQGNRQSTAPSISADGRYVAFASLASNLVSGDTNNEPDIFVHDRETGQTNRVSVASDGTQGNGGSYMPSISADGRYAAFKSSASNLVPGDTNGYEDIFVHDRETAQTERVSVASDGTQGNHWSSYLVISADGRYVAFASLASNLVSGDTNNELDIFVHDRETSQTKRVSVASDGAQADGGSWYNPSISADGRYVAFGSVASNLVPGDTNGMQDVFVHDRGTDDAYLGCLRGHTGE